MKIANVVKWFAMRLAKFVFLVVWFVFLKRKVGLGKRLGLLVFWLMRNQQWLKNMRKTRLVAS